MQRVWQDLEQSKGLLPKGLLFASVIIGAVAFASPVSSASRGWLCLASYVCFAGYLAPCLYAAAYAGHRHLLTVCVWSSVLVVLGIAVAHYAFYLVAGSNAPSYDSILSVVPVFVAIWAASVGWLIHFRITSKAQRTSHSFAIIMEMRKSTEIMSRLEMVSRHFPPGKPMSTADYAPFFPSDSLNALHSAADWIPWRIERKSLEMAEAVAALRYVLNYFEFMAAGWKAGDLDEEILRETISPIVRGVWKRAEPYVTYLRAEMPSGAGQAEAYEHLEDLVDIWAKKTTKKASP